MNPTRPPGTWLLLMALATAPALDAQVPLSPHSLGMAGATVATARGQEALFLNPANLGLPGNPYWSVAVPQLTVAGTLAGPGVRDLRDLAEFDDLPDHRRDELFALIPPDGAELRLDLRAPLALFQWRRFAVGVAYAATGGHGMSKDVAELLLYGYEEGRIDYDAAGTAGTQLTFWDFAVGYGGRAGDFSWGVAAHYLRGGTLLRSRVTDPRVNLEATDIDVDYVAVLSRGGNGFALDIGGAFQPAPALTLSAAVSNAFALMRWSDELYLRNVHLTGDDFDDTELSDLYDRFRDSERRVQPEDAGLVGGITPATLREHAYLPTVARLGADWRVARRTQLGLSYHGAITAGRMAGSWDHMLALGAEQRIPLIALRAGVATNFDGGTLLGGGVSLGPLRLGLSRVRDGAHVTEPRRGWVGAVGLATATRSRMP